MSGQEPEPNSPAALARLARSDLQNGEIDAAVKHVQRALDLDSDNLEANLEAIQICVAKGNPRAAVKHCQRVLDRDPDHPGLLEAYMDCAFGGVDYRDVLPLIHTTLAPEIYLEIGVYRGSSFQHARGADIAIGVDPNLDHFDDRHREWGHLFEMTSEDFFAADHLEDLAGERRIDLAFIDGMHLFEYALRDFVRVEKRSHADSIVLIHDVVPAHAKAGARMRETGLWMGDVWKALVALARHRPDLDISVIDAGPSGLGVIKRLDPDSTLLYDAFRGIVESLIEQPLDHAFLTDAGIRRVPAREGTIRELLTG